MHDFFLKNKHWLLILFYYDFICLILPSVPVNENIYANIIPEFGFYSFVHALPKLHIHFKACKTRPHVNVVDQGLRVCEYLKCVQKTEIPQVIREETAKLEAIKTKSCFSTFLLGRSHESCMAVALALLRNQVGPECVGGRQLTFS